MGEAALLIEHASTDVAVANAAVLALAEALTTQMGFDGVESVTPAIQSLLIRFDPLRCSRTRLEAHLQRVMLQLDAGASLAPVETVPHKIVEISVRYGGESGPDLLSVAGQVGLTPAEVIAWHTSQPWRVLMMGFAPGFAYLGPLPAVLHVPRRSTPRPAVPAGSVAIAAGMTGIYPAQLPGGWHLIGRTDEMLFDPSRQPPTRIEPGGWVRFVAVDPR